MNSDDTRGMLQYFSATGSVVVQFDPVQKVYVVIILLVIYNANGNIETCIFTNMCNMAYAPG